jgi:hypothetical protein
MIDLPHLAYNTPTTPERKPPVVIASKTRITKQQRKTRQAKEQERLDAKRHSPGVPPNSCPYIDMTKTIMDDMAAAYERLYEKGEHQPKFDDMKQLADDMLEYIRRANECLRDNSAYWYNKYKSNL